MDRESVDLRVMASIQESVPSFDIHLFFFQRRPDAHDCIETCGPRRNFEVTCNVLCAINLLRIYYTRNDGRFDLRRAPKAGKESFLRSFGLQYISYTSCQIHRHKALKRIPLGAAAAIQFTHPAFPFLCRGNYLYVPVPLDLLYKTTDAHLLSQQGD